jgi:hypothetical protein
MAVNYSSNIASTYDFISRQTLTSSAASVTFSKIPQGYTDLVLTADMRVSSDTGSAMTLSLNNETNTVYSQTTLNGSSSTAGSARASNRASNVYVNNGSAPFNSSTNSVNFTGHFFNYANANVYKTFLMKFASGKSDGEITQHAARFSSYTPITTITLNLNNSFASGCVFTLYGIKAAKTQIIPVKANGGDLIASDGTYTYHVFKSTGLFIPAQSLTADVLVIAGGGSGAGETPYADCGGGGAGGVLAFASQSLTSGTGYTCTVGAGGPGGGHGVSNNGGDSQFGSLTPISVGGGGGGIWVGGAGKSGGSGGGGSSSYSGIGTRSGGAGTSGQGFAGGNGVDNNSNGGGGGGGGAGGPGQSAPNGNQGGAGGAGTNSVTNWGLLSAMLTATGLGVSGYIAGGGGGANRNGNNGAAGSGGGTAGYGNQYTSNGSLNAVANTGSGSGASVVNNPAYTAGNGGSGVIVVRYAI